ncbi:MAG: TolC family protein [Micavibrio aeruginosavorus]|uniref:TolC family protein n=1 Tax=Micavibrio aeruginosavorus TaxID=349221 RepID=A0A7T5UG11_9BACT|nr:MAG: TolC family protein [Micavibrio aeruginosavorus]
MFKNFLSRFGAILCVVMSFSAMPAAAAQDNAGIDLDTVIAAALQAGPEAVLPEAARLEGESSAYDAGTLPDLEIEMLTTIREEGSRETEIEVIQPLRVSDFGSRNYLARSIRNLADAESKAAALDLSQRVTRLYTEAWAYQQREKLYKNNLGYAAKALDSLQDAATVGRADKAEADLFAAEVLRLTERQRIFQAAKRERLAEMSRISGMKYLAEAHLSSPSKASIPDNFETVYALAESPASLKNITQARLEMARRELDVVKADSVIGSFAPRLMAVRDHDEESTMTSAGINISLPVWGSNRAEIYGAQAARLQAEAAARALDGGHYEDLIRQSHFKALQTFKTAQNYENEILPAFRSVHKLSLTRFENGQSSMLDLWTVRERLIDVEQDYIEAVGAAIEARLAIESLLGTTLEVQP